MTLKEYSPPPPVRRRLCSPRLGLFCALGLLLGTAPALAQEPEETGSDKGSPGETENDQPDEANDDGDGPEVAAEDRKHNTSDDQPDEANDDGDGPEVAAENQPDEPKLALPELGEDDHFNEDEYFDEDDEELEFSAVAEVEAPAREPTKRELNEELLTRIPGTRGDALRAIEIMPGVSRTPYASTDGAPLLRGSPGGESIVLLDGAQVPLIYHFGGLTSFFNSNLLEKVELYPGNFSARFGRAAGGMVQAKVRDPKSDRFHARLELSMIDSQALVESPIGEKTSVALAARRSNIDFFFDALVPDDAFSVLAAPVYWDYQAIVAHRFNDRHKIRGLIYGSSDTLKLFIDDSVPGDPAVQGEIQGKLAFHRAQIELKDRFSDRLEHEMMISVGPSLGNQTLGQLRSNLNLWDINARSEWSIFANEQVRIDTGFDLQMLTGTGSYDGPAPSQNEGEPISDPLATAQFVTVDKRSVTSVRPAVYAEASVRPIEPWLIVPGVRADYNGDGRDVTVDPRLSSRLKASESTTFKAGVGLYSQPPIYFEMMEGLGNPDLKPFRTLQSSFGIEEQLLDELSIDVEGFYKRWSNRITGTEGGAPPRFLNAGEGRAYGMELLLNLKISPKTQAFVAYTLARSERRDGTDDWRLFDADQTHNISLTGSYDVGHGWVLGARFRYVTGNPTTPVRTAVYDASTDTYRAVYGPTNSDRNPAFHQLDLRVEKLWKLGPVGLTTYLEVMNVYNKKNQEGRTYSFDYSESEGTTGLPIFPNLGLIGEF